MHSLLKSNYYNRGVMNTVYITILKVILSKAVRFHSHCLYTCQRLVNVSETSHLLLSTIFIFTPSEFVTTMWDNVKPCCWGCKFYDIFVKYFLNIFYLIDFSMLLFAWKVCLLSTVNLDSTSRNGISFDCPSLLVYENHVHTCWWCFWAPSKYLWVGMCAAGGRRRGYIF